MKVSSINVVFVYVEDMQRAKQFYQERLGFGKPAKDGDQWVEWKLGKGSNFALCRADQRRLEASVPERSTVKFSMVVEDAEAARQELRDHGVELHGGIEKVADFCFFEILDPDGNVIRLLQWDK